MSEQEGPQIPAQAGTKKPLRRLGIGHEKRPEPPKRAHLFTPTLLVRFSFAIDLLLAAVLFYRAWERPDPWRIITIFGILEAVFVLFYLPVWWKIRRRTDISAHMAGAAYCLLRLYAVVTSVVLL